MAPAGPPHAAFHALSQLSASDPAVHLHSQRYNVSRLQQHTGPGGSVGLGHGALRHIPKLNSHWAATAAGSTATHLGRYPPGARHQQHGQGHCSPHVSLGQGQGQGHAMWSGHTHDLADGLPDDLSVPPAHTQVVSDPSAFPFHSYQHPAAAGEQAWAHGAGGYRHGLYEPRGEGGRAWGMSLGPLQAHGYYDSSGYDMRNHQQSYGTGIPYLNTAMDPDRNGEAEVRGGAAPAGQAAHLQQQGQQAGAGPSVGARYLQIHDMPVPAAAGGSLPGTGALPYADPVVAAAAAAALRLLGSPGQRCTSAELAHSTTSAARGATYGQGLVPRSTPGAGQAPADAPAATAPAGSSPGGPEAACSAESGSTPSPAPPSSVGGSNGAALGPHAGAALVAYAGGHVIRSGTESGYIDQELVHALRQQARPLGEVLVRGGLGGLQHSPPAEGMMDLTGSPAAG